MPADPLAPPRPELLALLDAIKDNPDEDTPRLVLADWLDEQDNELDARRARFIRKDIARFRAAGQPTARSNLAQVRVDRLWAEWLGPIADAATGGFERGLPVIRITGIRLLAPKFAALLASEAFAFVQFVDLWNTGELQTGRLAGFPELKHVPGFALSLGAALKISTSTKLLGSPHLTGVRRLDLLGIRLNDAGARVLASNSALARLRRLSLPHSGLSDAGVTALAGSAHLARLAYLDLGRNRIGDAGAEALVTSPHLGNLRDLTLCNNPRLTETGKQLLRDKFGDHVKC